MNISRGYDGPGQPAQGEPSPLDEALSRVGDRWTLLVVKALLDEPRRFKELLALTPGIAPNILTERLRKLERDGLLVSRPYSRRPVRLTYELTTEGRDLAGALRLLADWGSRRSQGTASFLHESCGTPVEARWFCATCQRAVEEKEASDLQIV